MKIPTCPAFTDSERLTIAALCRFHRKSMPQPRHSHFQALDVEARRWVTGLAAILRMADSLDRGHSQKVKDISSSLRDGTVCLSAEAETDADLEIWSAAEASKIFSDLYGLPLQVLRAKPARAGPLGKLQNLLDAARPRFSQLSRASPRCRLPALVIV